jgi:23S rRNA (adenine2503-C2)-methyltransferase
MRSFYDITREELEELLAPAAANAPELARRLFAAVYRARTDAWSEVPGLSPRERAWLDGALDLRLSPVTESRRSGDSSEKLVVSFADGSSAEAMLLPWAQHVTTLGHARGTARSLRRRARWVSVRQIARNFRVRDVFSGLTDRLKRDRPLGTACVSTQVGCAMGCTFCYTGTRGLKRNLRAGEIVEQLACVHLKAKVCGLVFMGMGEPLHNLDNLVRALRIIQDPAGLGISGDRIHVSTSGLVPEMDELSTRADVCLALSLNATTDEVRSQVMPVNKRWPIKEVIAACHRYERRSRRPVLVEYVLLAGVNDAPADSTRLAGLLRGLDARVQVIPFNGFEGAPFQRPTTDAVKRFRNELTAFGVPVSVRRSRGSDVAGACGQLGLSVPQRREHGRRRLLTTK